MFGSLLRRFAGIATVAVSLPGFLAFGTIGPAHAQTSPVIDGHIDDLILYARTLQTSGGGLGIIIEDAEGEVTVADPGDVPCDPAFVPGVSTRFTNGYDQTLVVVASVGRVLHLGIRVAGLIGDADGDGTPRTFCPQSTIRDTTPIGPDEAYKWRLDTDCDGVFESDITVTDGAVILSGLRGTGTYAFNGHDLEVQVNHSRVYSRVRVYTIVGESLSNSAEDFSAIGRAGRPCPPRHP